MKPKRIHVVAAVILNERGQVFIAKRPQHVHQGGLWEFPGGKLEPNESVEAGLARELYEEIGIEVEQARPLIRIRHDYPDKSVLLDVWQVSAFRGEAHGKEGQPVEWVEKSELRRRDFPAANQPIIMASLLPEYYLITPEPEDEAQFLQTLEDCLRAGLRLLQFRAHSLSDARYAALANKVIALAHRYAAKVLLNAEPALAKTLGADGVHLNSQRLRQWRQRPLGKDMLVAASCHSPAELQLAQNIDADFAVLSPVKATASHPHAQPLGWASFAEYLESTPLPVYALGGLITADLCTAQQYYAQGIAGISTFWKHA